MPTMVLFVRIKHWNQCKSNIKRARPINYSNMILMGLCTAFKNENYGHCVGTWNVPEIKCYVVCVIQFIWESLDSPCPIHTWWQCGRCPAESSRYKLTYEAKQDMIPAPQTWPTWRDIPNFPRRNLGHLFQILHLFPSVSFSPSRRGKVSNYLTQGFSVYLTGYYIEFIQRGARGLRSLEQS